MRTLPAIASVMFLAAASAPSQTTWQLAWSDEFNGAANSPPDRSKWNYDLGSGGWGNNELETYTNLPENAHLDGAGHLA